MKIYKIKKKIRTLISSILGLFFLISCTKSTNQPIQENSREENQTIETDTIKVNSEKMVTNYIVEEMVTNKYSIDLNHDGKEESIYMKMRNNLDWKNHLFYSYTWKNYGQMDRNVEYMDVFLDVKDGDTGEIYSAPLKREEEKWNSSIEEMKVICPNTTAGRPLVFLCIGYRNKEELVVQKRFYLLSCALGKPSREKWWIEYEEVKGINVTIHYFDNYKAEIIISPKYNNPFIKKQVVAQIDLEHTLEQFELEYLKELKYKEDGTIVGQEYEKIADIDENYNFVEASDNGITAKAYIHGQTICLGTLVVEYYFEDSGMYCRFALEETEQIDKN